MEEKVCFSVMHYWAIAVGLALLEQEFSVKKAVITYVGKIDATTIQNIQRLPDVQEITHDSSGSSQQTYHRNLEVLMSNSVTDQRKEDIVSEVVRMVAASRDCKIVSVASPRWSLEQVYLKLVRDLASDEEESREKTHGDRER